MVLKLVEDDELFHSSDNSVVVDSSDCFAVDNFHCCAVDMMAEQFEEQGDTETELAVRYFVCAVVEYLML